MHLQGTFDILKKRYKVTLTDDCLSWVPEGRPECCRRIPINEVLGSWLCPRGSTSCCTHANTTHASTHAHAPGIPSPLAISHCKHTLGKGWGAGLTLEYCERVSVGRGEGVGCGGGGGAGCGRRRGGVDWSTKRMVLAHNASEVIVAWHHSIWALLNGLASRPRRLAVVVNPVGGRRRALAIYKSKVAPLLHRAAIATSLTVTKDRGHGREVAEAVGEGVDGVMAVGGDGLVNEVVLGLLLRACRQADQDPHDHTRPLPSTQLRLGIIPGGSTDATCHGTHGTSDVVTAALHIIMGDSRNVDVAAVYMGDELQSVATSMVSYGYFGDLLKTSERWRWLGPSRYTFAGILQFLRNRSYEGHVKVLTPATPLSQPYDLNKCNHSCSVCNTAATSTSKPGEWLQFNGRWSIVTSAVTSCACRLTPHGVSPTAHLGDGCTDLILVSGGSRCRVLSYLLRTAYTGDAAQLNHVNMHRVQEVHFTPKVNKPMSSWNCDGEQLTEPTLRLKVHCQRLQLFSRGVESAGETYTKIPPSSSCKNASL